MSKTLADVRAEVLRRLGDTAQQIWTGNEVDAYLQDGYEQLAMTTGIFWETTCFPDDASSFNYTADFEVKDSYVDSLILWRANFTCVFERNWIDNAPGPANHTSFWEYDNGYVVTALGRAKEDLPSDLCQIERATWNSRRTVPLDSRELEYADSRYELTTGEVMGYLRDKDGVNTLRKWRVPSAFYAGYSVTWSRSLAFTRTGFGEESYDAELLDRANYTAAFETDYAPSGTTGPSNHNHVWEETYGYVLTTLARARAPLRGCLRVPTGLSTETVTGQWGTPRRIPGQHPMTDQWGLPRRPFLEANNFRLEYRRRGRLIGLDRTFELPDRWVKHLRCYALSKALDRQGAGQDKELAAHYGSRFAIGLARVQKRRPMAIRPRSIVMGAGSDSAARVRPPKPKLPWNYGQVVR